MLKAHDVLLGEPCYEVEFDDGTVIVASGDHLWMTADRAARISMANAPPATTLSRPEHAIGSRCWTA